jgi:hypothetical protein
LGLAKGEKIMDQGTKELANQLGNAGDRVGNILVAVIGELEDIQAAISGGAKPVESEALTPDWEKDFAELVMVVQDLTQEVEALKAAKPLVSAVSSTKVSETKKKGSK